MESNEIINREIDAIMQKAWSAFRIYSKYSHKDKKAFLYAIADELENSGDELIKTCMAETNLPEARLRNERGRTIFQLRSYADHCENGTWLDARIDTADAERVPPKPDIRKMNVPLQYLAQVIFRLHTPLQVEIQQALLQQAVRWL
jgi:NADP-dependent aldehyde dehydrogenase